MIRASFKFCPPIFDVRFRPFAADGNISQKGSERRTLLEYVRTRRSCRAVRSVHACTGRNQRAATAGVHLCGNILPLGQAIDSHYSSCYRSARQGR